MNDKPTTQESLIALEASIEKWKGIVRGDQVDKVVESTSCPLCYLGQKYNLPFACDACILADKTNAPSCDNTPFYETSTWYSFMSDCPQAPRPEDNRMLSMLYELRHDQIVKIIQERRQAE